VFLDKGVKMVETETTANLILAVNSYGTCGSGITTSVTCMEKDSIGFNGIASY
jgi:hypothetical protein